MLFAKYLLLNAGIAMFVIAAGMLTYDAYLLIAYRRGTVPADGKFFFTNDVLRGMNTANHVSQTEDAAEPNDK